MIAKISLVVFLIIPFAIIYIMLDIKEDKEIIASIVSAIALIVAGIIVHYQSKTREINARHFQLKIDTYRLIFDLFFEELVKKGKGNEPTHGELENLVFKFKKGLFIWGSPQVIKQWNAMETSSSKPKSKEDKVEDKVMEIDKLFRLIRKDLGHNDSSIPPGGLINLILKKGDYKDDQLMT